MCCFLPMTKNCTLPTCTLLLYFSSVMPKKQQFTGIILRCHMSTDLMKDWLNISWNKRECMLFIKGKEKKKGLVLDQFKQYRLYSQRGNSSAIHLNIWPMSINRYWKLVFFSLWRKYPSLPYRTSCDYL